MLIIVWIITAILVFSIIVLVHELGHFSTARFFWVKVEEFGLWIPPKAKRVFTDKKWTIYTLNWLPLWGFVRLKWESLNTFYVFDKKGNLFNNEALENAIKSNEDIFDEKGNTITQSEAQEILKKLQDNFAPDSLLTKKYYEQAVIILAGVVMNFILAALIFSFLFFIWVKPVGINDQLHISTPIKLIPTPIEAKEIWLLVEKPWVYVKPTTGSVAEKSGIKAFDLIVKVNEDELKNAESLKNIITQNANKELKLDIQRAKNNCDISKTDTCSFENISLSITPNNEGKIGAYLIGNIEINKDFRYKYGVLDSLKYGIMETYGNIKLTFVGIKTLLQKIVTPKTPTQRQEAISQVSGPIGMVDFMSKSISNGIIFIMIIGAMISINLWVFNLLPIPALDGWRFLFIVINGTIEKIFWKKAINEKLEWYIHVWFFIFLIALSVLIAYNDINKIINN